MSETKTNLNENEIPTHYYNVSPDIKKYLGKSLLPPLNPQTKQPISPSDLVVIFPKELIAQEVSEENLIKIPVEVRDLYRLYRPTPLVRARRLEQYLGTPAKIFFKNESVSPVGSHKLNTALPQAFYNQKEGVKKITTETGAGQWGSAVALAANFFGLKAEIYMVRTSYEHKPYRKVVMKTFGADVFASPSKNTEAGRSFLKKDPQTPGSLGMAISEAVEIAVKEKDTKYTLGSVLNHVLLHQTIIGQEAQKQLTKIHEYPDVIIGCVGGGSNFAGIAFPFIVDKLSGKKKQLQFLAVEPEACPSLTKGKYQYDLGDVSGLTPLLKMYTLGHEFVPDPIHAGGLRYHGMSPLISLLKAEKVIDAVAFAQVPVFEAAVTFAKTEGIIPAPESAHAIKAVIDTALTCKKRKEAKTILFNLSGHGLLDLNAYEEFLSGKLE